MQDSFLPHVENGTITLLGATTENPSFQLNSALLSRCRVVILEKLKSSDIVSVLKRAMGRLNADVVKEITASTDKSKVWIKPDALDFLANLSDGDARIALNGLQLTVQIKKTQAGEEKSSSSTLENKQSSHSRADSTPEAKLCTVTLQDIKSCLQKTHLLYDRAGDEHYHIISALHKSMRGSDANAALYWLARMLCAGEDPLYIARRVIRFASEDVGKYIGMCAKESPFSIARRVIQFTSENVKYYVLSWRGLIARRVTLFAGEDVVGRVPVRT